MSRTYFLTICVIIFQHTGRIFIRYYALYIYIFVSLYLYVPDEGSLLPKYRDCTTYNDFELYLMCCGVMLLLLIIYIYIVVKTRNFCEIKFSILKAYRQIRR